MRGIPSAVLLAFAGACSGGTGDAPEPVRNTGLAALDLVGDGDLLAVLVSEAEQGGIDLDGDGDALDTVLHVLDLEAGVLTSPGLAVTSVGGRAPLVACANGAVAFAVDEAAQGGVDLNGDGDALDRVLHVLDRAHGTAESLGRAVRSVLADGDLVACAIDEADDGGRDLDRDGDADGTVLGIHDARDGSFTVFTLRDSAPLAIAGGNVALGLSESDGLDLTLDGDDQDELVLEVWDGETRLLQNTTLALASREVVAAGRILGVFVSESGRGRGDLSGDGDDDDAVFHVHDPLLGLWVNLGLVVTQHPAPASDGERFLLHALEAGAGEDWNEDGDLDDLIVHVFDAAPGVLYRTDLASAASAVLLGGWVGVSVSEAMQGSRDLDGDGEAGGNVVQAIDLATGVVVPLGLDTRELAASGSQLFLAPFADGAAPFGRELYGWSAARPGEPPRALGGAVARVLSVRDEVALVSVPDGTGGLALELVDARAGARRPLGLAAGRVARLTPGLWVAALVEEAAQGADLNGDGDRADEVLQLVPPAPR